MVESGGRLHSASTAWKITCKGELSKGSVVEVALKALRVQKTLSRNEKNRSYVNGIKPDP